MNKNRNPVKKPRARKSAKPRQPLKTNTPCRRLAEVELINLLKVLQGELRQVALLALLTRRSPSELIKWNQGDVLQLIEELAREFQGLNPAPDTPLFPGLVKLPAWLLGGQKRRTGQVESAPMLVRNVLMAVASNAAPQSRRERGG
jgi:hypothetical protein